MEKSKIDFLCGGTQKWLLSSNGLSYIFLTEELQNRIVQKNVGWASVDNAWDLLDYDLTFKSSADRFQSGTVNTLGVAVFDSMLYLFLKYGIDNVENRILENTKYFLERLSNIGVQPILKDVAEKRLAGIVTFEHERAKEIFDELEKRRIYCAVREGMIRFSPHFYNTKEEIEEVVKYLEVIVEREIKN